MEDSSQVLEHGTGTPYVAIFNNLKEVIIEPKSGLPLGTFITNFQYEREIVNELEAKGLIYGKNFISIRREYMRKVCYLRRYAD